MRPFMRWLVPVAVGVVSVVGVAMPGLGADHILTIGGGYNASGNQVSLERNIVYFRRMLKDLGLSHVPHDVFFADGDAPERDLQFQDPNFAIPRTNLLLAVLFNQTKGLHHEYRNHDIGDLRGMTSKENLEKWFDTTGKQLKDGDRLFIYLTGHGGKASKDENTSFYMWNNQSMTVSDFVKQLDKLSPGVKVVIVMVQCFSGGFANVIFNEGDKGKGVSESNRCGFYATIASRVAAGCTPDINEENYQEYSSFFWAGLYGHTRTGQPVERPDYDGDGRICFAEAHAYTILTSGSIDIPVKTSDALLRAHSKLKNKDQPELADADTDYSKLIQMADAYDRAVLEGLSSALGLSQEQRAKEAGELAKKLMKDKDEVNKQQGKIRNEYNAIRGRIAGTIKNRWPEMDSPWHPRVRQAIDQEGDQIVSMIESHGEFKRFEELANKLNEMSQQSLDLDKQWAKTQRFVRVAENVALRANLAVLASEDVQRRYDALCESERGLMVDPDAPARPRPDTEQPAGQ